MKRSKVKDWQCQGCGKRMTLQQAEKAMSTGCTKCGGSDVDLFAGNALRETGVTQ
jgi:Zn finger protein HypA/HybF involved in hydrogenase expression